MVRLASVVGNLAGISGALIVASASGGFLALGRAVAFFGGLGILFGALSSPGSLGILTLVARQRFNPFLGREQ